MKISNMTSEDFSEIKSIYNSEFDNLWSINILKSELENSNSKYIVAKSDDEIVGFAGLWFSVDDAHITNIVVKKDKRHIGIGSKLLEELIDLTKKQKKLSITLEVNTKNIPAQNLYLKYGFENLGIRKKYYNGIEDAFIMTLYV